MSEHINKTGTAVALGFFDGLHLAHRQVLAAAAAQREKGLQPCVLLFDDHPQHVLNGKTVPQLTASKLLDELGINAGYIGECQEIKEADPKKSVLTIYYQRNYGTDSGTLYIYGVSKDSSGNIIYDGSSVIRIVEGITNFSTVGGGYPNMFGGYLAAG